jgi:phosphoribosylamine--glycine ligase
MGSVSPVPFANSLFMEKVKTRIIEPTLAGLKAEGIRYTGFIFFGLINCNGDPYVIEYNVRMGDPETEAVMPRIKSDFLSLLNAAACGTIGDHSIEIENHRAATVMLVSGGYPGEFKKGFAISGCRNVTDSILFHAGTKMDTGNLITSGGRVLAVTSTGATPSEALKKCYNSVRLIDFEGKYFRPDIGFDLSQ